MEQYGYEVMNHVPIDYSYGICVDGISVNGHFEIYSLTESSNKEIIYLDYDTLRF